jgi:hypothetical protein
MFEGLQYGHVPLSLAIVAALLAVTSVAGLIYAVMAWFDRLTLNRQLMADVNRLTVEFMAARAGAAVLAAKSVQATVEAVHSGQTREGAACMNEPIKATPDQAGCWVDGVRGIYAGVHMVDIAIDYGYVVDDDDAPVFAWARNGRIDAPGRDDWPEFWDEIQDEVTGWLTDHVAPDGYLFEWHDGDLMMWSEAASCEASGDRCQDTDHGHHAINAPDDSFAAHCEGY